MSVPREVASVWMSRIMRGILMMRSCLDGRWEMFLSVMRRVGGVGEGDIRGLSEVRLGRHGEMRRRKSVVEVLVWRCDYI